MKNIIFQYIIHFYPVAIYRNNIFFQKINNFIIKNNLKVNIVILKSSIDNKLKFYKEKNKNIKNIIKVFLGGKIKGK